MELCQVELFGGIKAIVSGRVVARFRTEKTALLLAYCAYFLGREHPRETLIEMLWPDSDPDQARNSLSKAVSSLRNQLEPAGIEPGTVLQADRRTVGLNPDFATCDAHRFARLIEAANKISDPSAEMAALEQAVGLFKGELMPGFYADWIMDEQPRLHDAYVSALNRLAELHSHNPRKGLEYAKRAVAADPLREDAHVAAIRLMVASGDRASAQRQYQALEKMIKEEWGNEPSQEAQDALQGKFARQTVRTPVLERSRPVVVGVAAAILPAPEEVEQTLAAVSPESRKGNLPSSRSRFVGRESELERLCDMLGDAQGPRLITLIGFGGVGKTRLALQSARNAQSAFPGGAWFVQLQDVDDPSIIPDAIASVLRLTPIRGASTLDQSAAVLSESPSLLILDNFEQLIEGGVETLPKLLDQASTLRIIVTSRLPLGLAAEQEFPISLLPLPTDDELESLQSNPCVELFIDRAQQKMPDFALSAGNAASVAQLCRELEGIPLAIELAAARIRLLSPRQMVERISQRLDWLTSPRKDLAERQRTLRGTVEWSMKLLDPELRTRFSQLSVFRGGWNLEAAEAILEWPDALEGLHQLQESSLIIGFDAADERRYRLLETLQAYGWSQLAPHEQTKLRLRHLQYFIDRAEEDCGAMLSERQLELFGKWDSKVENVWAALAFAESHGEWDQGVRLIEALRHYFGVKGYWGEILRWLEKYLAAKPANTVWHGIALVTKSASCIRVGDYVGAQSAADQAEQIIDPQDQTLYLRMLLAKATVAWSQARHADAEQIYGKALELAESMSHRIGIAEVHNGLGNAYTNQGNYLDGIKHIEIAMKLRREQGDLRGVAGCLNNMGLPLQQIDRLDEAMALFEEARDINLKMGNYSWLAHNYLNIGTTHQYKADIEAADEAYQQALKYYARIGDLSGAAAIKNNMGNVQRSRGNYAKARELYESSLEFNLRQRNMLWEAKNYRNLASTLLYSDELEQGWDYAQRALAKSKEINDNRGIFGAYEAGVELLYRLNRVRESFDFCAQCVQDAFEVGSPVNQVATLRVAAQLFVHVGLLDSAGVLVGASMDRLEDDLLNAMPDDQQRWEAAVDKAKNALGAKNWQRLIAEGQALKVVDALQLASKEIENFQKTS